MRLQKKKQKSDTPHSSYAPSKKKQKSYIFPSWLNRVKGVFPTEIRFFSTSSGVSRRDTVLSPLNLKKKSDPRREFPNKFKWDYLLN